jgi:hypothetical protein
LAFWRGCCVTNPRPNHAGPAAGSDARAVRIQPHQQRHSAGAVRPRRDFPAACPSAAEAPLQGPSSGRVESGPQPTRSRSTTSVCPVASSGAHGRHDHRAPATRCRVPMALRRLAAPQRPPVRPPSMRAGRAGGASPAGVLLPRPLRCLALRCAPPGGTPFARKAGASGAHAHCRVSITSFFYRPAQVVFARIYDTACRRGVSAIAVLWPSPDASRKCFVISCQGRGYACAAAASYIHAAAGVTEG